MKRKIILSGVLMLLSAVLSLFLSYNLNYLLLRKRNMYSVKPSVLISGLTDPKIRTFFILFLLAFALFIVYMLVIQSYIKYKSDMQDLTPEIRTPKAEGQGQYGTARWIETSKYSKIFSAIEVDKDSELIQNLISHGYDDAKGEDS